MMPLVDTIEKYNTEKWFWSEGRLWITAQEISDNWLYQSVLSCQLSVRMFQNIQEP